MGTPENFGSDSPENESGDFVVEETDVTQETEILAKENYLK